MKNILILIMSCQEDFFRNQVRHIEDTWGNRKFLPDNVDVISYEGGHTDIGIAEPSPGRYVIHTDVPDDFSHTLIKTVKALYCVLNGDLGKQYDWIMRINTSTWVNTRLLSKLCETVLNEHIVYGTDLYSLTEAACPFPLDLYCRGNAIIMSNSLARVLCQYSYPLLYTNQVDDVAIGNIFNSYNYTHNENYLDYIGGLPHGWYKATVVKQDWHHKLSKYGDDYSGQEGIDFYNRLLTVQTKMYRRRDKEDKNMEEFWNMMKDAPEPSIDTAIEYMKDPSVFIGSILGYIDYSLWKNIPKQTLYEYEMRNKAADDKQNPNFSQELYNRLHGVPGMKEIPKPAL